MFTLLDLIFFSHLTVEVRPLMSVSILLDSELWVANRKG